MTSGRTLTWLLQFLVMARQAFISYLQIFVQMYWRADQYGCQLQYSWMSHGVGSEAFPMSAVAAAKTAYKSSFDFRVQRNYLI